MSNQSAASFLPPQNDPSRFGARKGCLVDRRSFLRGTVAGSVAVGSMGLVEGFGGIAGASVAAAPTLDDAGVGVYTDPSVAEQISAFTINRRMVSCAVGTVSGSGSGPFAMLMFAVQIDSYDVRREAGEIVAMGRMRSITRVAGSTVEDTLHPFMAVGIDGKLQDGHPPDRFETHFVTEFWNPSNPLATPSDRHQGWVMFGGDVIEDENGDQLGQIAIQTS
jgi:hypothetical protein